MSYFFDGAYLFGVLVVLDLGEEERAENVSFIGAHGVDLVLQVSTNNENSNCSLQVKVDDGVVQRGVRLQGLQILLADLDFQAGGSGLVSHLGELGPIHHEAVEAVLLDIN